MCSTPPRRSFDNLFLLKDLEDTVKKGIGLWVLRFMVCSVGFW